jgi:protein-tyrosine-phosphatase
MTGRSLPNPSRRTLFLLAAAALAPVGALAAPCAPPRVLLVCPAGTVKSAIAREVLKRRAAARGMALSAASRGVTPEDHVSPALAAHLQADGIDTTAQPPRRFDARDLEGADVVIAFDEAAQVPALRDARVWTTPSWNQDYAAARAALDPQVEALLDELAARGCATR